MKAIFLPRFMQVDIVLFPECDKIHNALKTSDLILYKCKKECFLGNGELYKWVATQSGGFIGVFWDAPCTKDAWL